MRRKLPEVLPWLIALGASSAAAVLFVTNGALDAQFELAAPRGHFYIVSAVALISVVVGGGGAAVGAAYRTANLRVLLLALAFLSMAGIFAVHGLATPGFILDQRAFGVTRFSARLAVLVSSMFLGLRVVPWSTTVEAQLVSRRQLIAFGWIAVLVGYAAVAITDPESLPPDLILSPGFQTTAVLVTIALSGVAAMRSRGTGGPPGRCSVRSPSAPC
jgi:hypothetical protein